MSVLVGVGWLFGFVASFIDVTALWWLFIIFTSLHGVSLFISFVSSSQFREVLDEYRQQQKIKINRRKDQIDLNTISK